MQRRTRRLAEMWQAFVLILVLTALGIDSKDGDIPQSPEIDSKDGDFPDIPIPPGIDSKDGADLPDIPIPPGIASTVEELPDIPIPPGIHSKDGDLPDVPKPPGIDSRVGDRPDVPKPPGIDSRVGDRPDVPKPPGIDSRVGDRPDVPKRMIPRCADNNEACQAWAENNMCFTQAKYMLKNCRKSCKVCSDRKNSFQNSKHCDEWAKNGNCEKGAHVDWMHENCALSCDCVDKFVTSIAGATLCVFAAENGLCDGNEARNKYLRENCRRSCGLCPQEKCIDAGGASAACQERARSGQCLKYADWMNKNCRKSCGNCLEKCIDAGGASADCQKRAMRGQCLKYADWMNTNCRKSCGNCLVHGKSYRSYRKNKSKQKPASISASTAESCGISRGVRVVGGQDSVPGAWPWQVLVMRKGHLGKVHCGGVLINQQWVLTASHCFGHPKSRLIRARHIKVRLAEHDLTRKTGHEIDVDVVKLVRHENFTYATHDNDIALLKLARPVKYDGLTRPVCMPERFSQETPDKECFITGWGRLKAGGESATKLQVAEVPIIDNSVCKKVMKSSHVTITKNMVCAGYFWKEIDACSGDSGGPLVCQKGERFELIGLTSYGKGCAKKKTYGVYTKVSNYIDWISQSIHND